MVNQKLKAARVRKLWSQADGAEKVGVSVITYGRWENSAQKPYLKLLKQLCEAFEMSPEELGFDAIAGTAKEAVAIVRSEAEIQAIHTTPLIILTSAQIATLLDFLHLGDDEMAHFNAERRAALLEMLGIASAVTFAPLIQNGPWEQFAPEVKTVTIDEKILEEFERLTFICWRLLRGNDMASVEFLLPKFFQKFPSLVQQPTFEISEKNGKHCSPCL
jgi:transcriptional regulator with XRE-family HTH domain